MILNDYELTDFEVRLIARDSIAQSDIRLRHRLLLLSDSIEAEIELAITHEEAAQGIVISDARLRSLMADLRMQD